MGITMDYIIITDPKEISNRQIQGVEHMEVPMILLSTATKGVARYYKGEKYMLCQKGFPDAEQYACERGLPLFETGGSVATTALDLCVRFDVNKIIFIGLDMAYTGNKNHAEGARDEGITDYEDMLNFVNMDKISKDIDKLTSIEFDISEFDSYCKHSTPPVKIILSN